MVKTMSQDGDSKGKELDVEDPTESRLSRLEDLFAARNKMMKQFADMVEAFSRSTAGKMEFGDDQPPNGEFGESVEHRMVNLVPEAQEENPKLENHEGWEQMVILEVEGDVEKGQEVQIMEKICSAHQVFDKMSLGVQSKRRQIKCHKSWRFKFKQRKQQRGKPRIAHKLIYKGILMIDSEDHLSSSMVKESGIEISSDRWLSNSIGCELEIGETVNDEYRVPSDSDLIMNDIEKDKERLKWKERRKSLKSWGFKFKSRDLRGHNLSRVTLLLKNSLVITGSWRRFMMVKGYEQCHMLEHANIEAESFLLLNFAAEQPILWMQNNCEAVLTVSELERKKKKLCYKTWMFKYKAPLKGVQFLHYFDKEVPKKTNWAVQRIWDKDSHEVHITDANKQTEYTREGRRWLVNIYDWCILSQLFILIDSGSIHNFMDSKIAEKLGCLVEYVGLTHVSVADGNKLDVKGRVDGFKWNFQSTPFEADVMLIPLGGGDMVLGVQWLETLGPITWDFKKLEMSFMIGKQKVLLHGMKPGSVREVKAQKLNKLQEDQV